VVVTEAAKYLRYIMDRFYPIGEDRSGGVTRLAYTEAEDQMHDELIKIGQEEGYKVEIDEVGNTFLSINKPDNYYLIGSHLDSVVNGGRYDGVLGVAAGLLLLKRIKESDFKIPLKVVAFRCEESANFMKATLGSSLITGEYDPKDFNLKSKTGKALGQVFKERGYNPKPEIIKGVLAYLELHIEQGRVLETENLRIGVVSSIAGNTRFKVNIEGLAEHSGATPMNIRKDALCDAAEIILGIEKIGQEEYTAATVGVIENHPNSLNVIPGNVELVVDIRDNDNEKIEKVRLKIYKLIEDVCNRRDSRYSIEFLSSSEAVQLDKGIQAELSKIATGLGIKHKVMTSGAGHDAMKLAKVTKAGMLFIPCKNGISHNPKEEAKLEDAALGAEIMFRYLKG